MAILFKIAGWGVYRPEQQVLSRELDDRYQKDPGWTERQFGISSRGIASQHETSSAMGAAAARAALEKAGWGDDFDLIIGACGVMEQPIPSTSVLIQQKLGLGKSGIPTFDVNLTCLSFLSAMDIALMGMSCQNWKRVLIVSSDIASAGLSYDIPEIASIFGDGSAAICIEATSDKNGSAMLSRKFETYGDGHELATLRTGGTRIRVGEGYDALVQGSYFDMNTFGVFKAAARCLPKLIDIVLQEAGHTRETIDLIVCHQASAPGVEHIKRLFSSNPDRVVNIFPDHGNQIATSIPTVLSYVLENKLARSGQTIFFLGTAAGISAGGMVVRL